MQFSRPTFRGHQGQSGPFLPDFRPKAPSSAKPGQSAESRPKSPFRPNRGESALSPFPAERRQRVAGRPGVGISDSLGRPPLGVNGWLRRGTAVGARSQASSGARQSGLGAGQAVRIVCGEGQSAPACWEWQTGGAVGGGLRRSAVNWRSGLAIRPGSQARRSGSGVRSGSQDRQSGVGVTASSQDQPSGLGSLSYGGTL